MQVYIAATAARSSLDVVAEQLLATLGLYVATPAVGFLAGVFPLLSIEAFLFGVATWGGVGAGALVALVGIAAVGHQVAKTVTYYAGAGALELPGGRMRERIAAARQRIERWNRRPRLVMLAAATTGLPPLYPLGFVARPLLNMPIATFTAISLAGRVARFAAVVAVARLI